MLPAQAARHKKEAARLGVQPDVAPRFAPARVMRRRFVPDLVTIAVFAVFVLAGLVKGVIGLGLPTVSLGLLAALMPPAQAAAILILPSLVTNVWQAFVGPYLKRLALRLWPTFTAAVAGTLIGSGWMTGAYARAGAVLLGLALVAYAVIGLAAVKFTAPRSAEIWLGPVVGLVTGFITAATGVFVIPLVPYLQAIGLEKDELVQALGLSFLVATFALAGNLFLSGALTAAVGPLALLALAAAGVGMAVGQVLRGRMDAATFRKAFFIGLLLLGLYLILRSFV